MVVKGTTLANRMDYLKNAWRRYFPLNSFSSLVAALVLSCAMVLGGVNGVVAADYTAPEYKDQISSGANGGVITNFESESTVSDDVIFQNNSVIGNSGAGAIFSRAQSSNTKLTIGNNVQFIGNSSGGVGALYVLQLSGKASSVATLGTNVLFEGNSSTDGGGGAVSVYAHQSNNTGSGGASLIIDTGATFKNNSALKGGGALVATGQNATFIIGSGATFEGNSDASTGTGNWNGGGAILMQNHAQGTLSGATFTNNTTGATGGAIRVGATDSVLNFNGTNIFSGNQDSFGFNDIDNIGTINVSGKMSLDGGITGSGTTNFKRDSILIVGDNTKLEQGSFNVEGGAKLVVTREGELTIKNVTFENVSADNSAWGWDGSAIDLNSDTLDFGLFEAEVSYVDNIYSILLTINREEIKDVLGPDAADGMNDFIEDVLANDPDTAGGAFVRDNASKVEGAAKLAILGGVIPALSDVNAAATFTTGTRTALPFFDDMDKGLGIWFMPMFSHTNANGFSSGKSQYGFDTNIVGATLGADYTFAHNLRLGLAFLVGDGSASSKGDFADTDNNFNYVGVSLYGAKHFERLGLSFDMNYIKSDNDMSQYHAASNLYGDAGASLFTIGGKAEYLIPLKSFNMTPYAGVRFNYYDVDAYDTMQSGQALFSTASMYNTVWEIPVGLTFDTTTQLGSWKVTPSLGLGVKFAMGDLDAKQSVSIAGGTSNIILASEIADDVTYQGTLGLGFVQDNWNIGLNYNLDLSENVESHGLSLNLRYEF